LLIAKPEAAQAATATDRVRAARNACRSIDFTPFDFYDRPGSPNAKPERCTPKKSEQVLKLRQPRHFMRSQFNSAEN
jgi:hypothetical protein